MNARVSILLVLSAALVLAGCGPRPGAAGLWDLRVGGKARLVGEGGAKEIVVRSLAAPAKSRARKAEPPKIETVTLATGTGVDVLAVDGDDARVRLADGPRTGSIYWIECRLLERAD